MANFCTRCGTALDETDRFCRSCGNRVDGVMPPVYPPITYTKPKTPGRGFGISSMVLGIIGLVYGFGSWITAVEMLLNQSVYDSLVTLEEEVGSLLVFSVLSILAICFYASARKRGYNNGVSKAGLVTGLVGLLLYIAGVVLALVPFFS